MKDLVVRLRELEHGKGRALGELLPDLAAAVGGGKPASYSVRVGDEGYELDFLHARGMTCSEAECAALWSEVFANGPPRGLLYTPARPERAQQNRAYLLPRPEDMVAQRGDLRRQGLSTPDDLTPYALHFEAFRAMGVHQDHVLRTLVCEGDAMLAWVGVYRPEPFTARDQQVLQALAPALRARLSLEQRLDLTAFAHGAIGVLIEQIPGAAALVGPNGRMLASNAAMRARFDRDPAGTREALSAAAKGAHPLVEVTRVRSVGVPDGHLVVFPRPSALDERVEHVRGRHGLTPRQAEVLRMLARGASNRVIAATLDCAERTIELHVTAILAKLGVESRAGAVARLYADD